MVAYTLVRKRMHIIICDVKSFHLFKLWFKNLFFKHESERRGREGKGDERFKLMN
jgi:hypothetical protein